ncbi:MAG: hypothetical protein R3Y11_07625 [Pseudomonadota bacterium]
MSLATLTTSGRAPIAKAIVEQPLHLAWGTGSASWTEDNLPSIVGMTELVAEVGRRIPTKVGYVTPDESGDIVIPISAGAQGAVEEARYTLVTEDTPTPYVYILTNFDYADASNVTIREMAVFMGGEVDTDLPDGQRYFVPSEVTDNGIMLAAQIVMPTIERSPSVRQSIEFVLPI